MDFGFTEEQAQLKSQVRRFVESECPLDRVRGAMQAEQAYDAALWSKAAELGWQALTVPEAYGGLGLAWEDLVVVAEELGRGLFPSPLLPNAAAARLIARCASEAQKKKWLPRIAEGRCVATLALLEQTDLLTEDGVQMRAAPADASTARLNGEKRFVAYGQAADLVLVAAREAEGVSLFAVEANAPGLGVEPLALVDATHRAAHLEFRDVLGQRLGEAGACWPAIEDAVDALTVALAAEMVGAADAAVTMATEYAKVRKQFGQVIGRFQGVKHRLAELHVGVESARSLVYYAGWAVDHLEDPRTQVSMAKAYASTALDEAGEDCIQLHGAIGYTWECDAHLYYKRGRYCRNLLGSPEYHHERVLTSQGL